MKLIPLTKGKFAKVDDEDFDLLNQWKWHYIDGYAAKRITYAKGKSKIVRMQRFIMQTPEGMETDHRNGDKLDNRRSNLRVCTHSQNGMNKAKQSNNTSGYKGISWHKKNKAWRVRMNYEGKERLLGYFKSLDEAVSAYNRYVHLLHGEYGRFNL